MLDRTDVHLIPAPPETRATVAALVEHYRRNADLYSGPFPPQSPR